MADIGADLRQARLARKLTIDDISRATKITPSIVRAIESDAFDRLPGGLFTRGFLRAYAREVGLDPEEIVGRYRDLFEPVPGPEADTEKQRDEPVSSVRPSVVVDGDTASSRKIQILQLCIILLVVALYFAVSRRPREEARSDAKTVAAEAVTQTAETPVATNGTVLNKPQGPMTLELRPQGPCWIEAVADGERVVAKLMDAGQTETITVRNEVMLRVGDPAAFAFTLDGVAGRSVGDPGRPAWIRLDRQNYKTFLQSQ